MTFSGHDDSTINIVLGLLLLLLLLYQTDKISAVAALAMKTGVKLMGAAMFASPYSSQSAYVGRPPQETMLFLSRKMTELSTR